MSGGEQQMLAVARALARDIKLLLLDEPYEGLAPVIVREIEKIVQEIKRLGITTIIVEQNALAALELADRAVILDMGGVVFDGLAREVLESADLRTSYLAISRRRRHYASSMRIAAFALAALFVSALGSEPTFARPAAIEDKGSGGAADNAEASAREAALHRLFESLREAASPELARGIEQVIWSIWLEAGGAEVDRLMALSVQAMNAQDYPAARSYLDKIVVLEPDFAEGWNKRATVHFLEGDYDRSLSDIRRVLLLEPRHFGALSGLGLILEQTGRKAEALEAFRRALDIHPQMPGIQMRAEALAREIEGIDM
jgi:tetratricopeptide (TPR) repeat protein